MRVNYHPLARKLFLSANDTTFIISGVGVGNKTTKKNQKKRKSIKSELPYLLPRTWVQVLTRWCQPYPLQSQRKEKTLEYKKRNKKRRQEKKRKHDTQRTSKGQQATSVLVSIAWVTTTLKKKNAKKLRFFYFVLLLVSRGSPLRKLDETSREGIWRKGGREKRRERGKAKEVSRNRALYPASLYGLQRSTEASLGGTTSIKNKQPS